jgi:hypothetical protein
MIVPRDFFQKRAAHPLERAAFDLIAQPIGIRDRPAVRADHQALHRDHSIGRVELVDRNEETRRRELEESFACSCRCEREVAPIEIGWVRLAARGRALIGSECRVALFP